MRMSLIHAKATLNVAAYDYAKAGLGAAQEAYNAAVEEAPCSVVWRSMVEAQQLLRKSGEALQSCLRVTALLLEAEQTEDDAVNDMNRLVKVEHIEQHVISALIEGANTRLKIVKTMIPENPAPGARCKPQVIG